MAQIEKFLSQVSSIVWGLPLLVLLVGTGVYLTIRLGALQVRSLPYALKLAFSRNQDKESDGDISHFQALMTASAATVGTGNIVGVATAVLMGGPGAIFWMWLAGFFGMATKYGEAILAVKYRVKDAEGNMAGGPMYYLEHGLKQKWLGVLFAVFGALAAFGIGNGTQSKAIADLMNDTFSVPFWVTGVVLVIFAGMVILGGIKWIGRVTAFFVPIMAIFYILAGIIVMIMNLNLVPEALGTIFTFAFTGEAAAGGAVGAAIRFGVARGLFSNEAGLGSAPIAAAAAKTDLPGRQALVSMTQVLIDTFIVCSITGITIVMSGDWQNESIKAGVLTSTAFETLLGSAGPYVITLGLLFFATSTILGWGYYGEKCFQYLFKNPVAVRAYRTVFVLFIFVGATASLDVVWTLADVLNGLMAAPNLIGLLGLSGVIIYETKRFQKKAKEEQERAAS
ncbi:MULTISPECIES: alanine/glycine:cation symporter family protein [Virgibacillus]|uniref:Transporter n=1 Tax=Virgibacillus pantothenticus TaxID=1473 RepID=A0A0L0QL91_VIRPA|nr:MULTISPECIES: sodium:alanine symporter family protein [Virgibacillus]API91616.1 sodium:alanine symporter family protein [Virgibacillus sp. 6R]KNE19362.1 transporter [Virgibacillus pantothenticus]MBS7426862.1 sodium:alanine symporter family protein [Virgibacillus sp. 19R1-5]MBU8568309.1 sodium:alanine symporter family protein [Virgibacillus pantothenticus]MBU8602214.1 sodium:alanine symporter family protein [Virgibacillus pantothenticus]